MTPAQRALESQKRSGGATQKRNTGKLLFLMGSRQIQPHLLTAYGTRSANWHACYRKGERKSIKEFYAVSALLSWFIMRTVCRSWTAQPAKAFFSNIRLRRIARERPVPRANVGHRSGKERNKFHRIMVKTTVVCFLKRLDINLKHMSVKV